MEIRTYTHIWSQSRVFYTFMDWTLPKPIPVNTALIFLVTAVVWIPLLHFLLFLPVTNPYAVMAYLSVPLFASYFGSRPIFEEKTLFQYVSSQLGYFAHYSQTLSDLKFDDKDSTKKKELHPIIWNHSWKGGHK